MLKSVVQRALPLATSGSAIVLPTLALAQTTEEGLTQPEAVSGWMVVTFGAVLIAAIAAFAYFLRKPEHRTIARQAVDPTHPRNKA